MKSFASIKLIFIVGIASLFVMGLSLESGPEWEKYNKSAQISANNRLSYCLSVKWDGEVDNLKTECFSRTISPFYAESSNITKYFLTNETKITEINKTRRLVEALSSWKIDGNSAHTNVVSAYVGPH